jgi:hypothetical protein
MGGVAKARQLVQSNGVKIELRPHLSKKGRRYTRRSKFYRVGDDWVVRT